MSNVTNKLKGIFWPGDAYKDKPVYLQETGELLGYVSDIETDDTGNIEFYRVDSEGMELTFSSENLIKDKNGYIYRPIWLTEAERLIKKLETQQKLNPEISTQNSESLDRKELNRLFRANPELEKIVKEAEEIVQLLIEKKDDLQEKEGSLEQEIEEKAQKRMAGEGSRKDFAESIVNLKRKVKIVKENLNKLDQLFTRLNRSPFVDVENLKSKVKKDIYKEDENYMTERTDLPVKAEDKKEARPQSREPEEGERIKKVRIPKLEQKFEQKEVELQQAYLSDLQERIQNINQDVKDLKKLAEEHEGDEKITDFIDKKLENLKKEKKAIRDKINEVKKNKNSLQETNVEKEKKDTRIEGVVEEKVGKSTEQKDRAIKGKMIARIGSLALIIGLIVLLILSLLRVF